ncbi:MAG: hypothetical protein PHO85_02215 [Candidatus Cloacimonetes bacterium]|jgi:hypothetical protein|nr:hypothetical protein [Candidatus Cloacimonadota bacterium]MDD2506177.1 hypothetical protein [Candidatus Cloacimonadota bacterium]MDD4147315.1 hypothetical protein [Candidatus Cloacimonadota bacterium]MDD4559347.1 hypothetical protein [Candidatus Cloacimonadota bacterium]
MNKSLWLLLVLLSFLLQSCDLDNEESFGQKEIRDILYDISMDFNLGNSFGIMDHVHQEYRHDGQISWHLNEEINRRRDRFQLLEIEVLYIEIKGDYAVAYTRDHYQSSIEQVTYNEPEDSGYFSYFFYTNGTWLIYGNQRW